MQIKDNEAQIISENVERLDIESVKSNNGDDKEFMGVILPDGKDCLEEVMAVLESYPGDIPVIIAMNGKKYDSKLSVRKADGLLAELHAYVNEKDIIFFKKNKNKS